MALRILAFARVRELLGKHVCEIPFRAGMSVGDAWRALRDRQPNISEAEHGLRFARNGRIAQAGERLDDGDEIALLPPVGGG